ncbi:excinuclease ABC subunit UvrA [soil metagenome]
MSTATRQDAQSDAQHVADSHDLIRVHGARVNNLNDISVEIPKRRLTVFTGVSGSGKSSLVFATIAAESQRLINETYSAFVQGFMPTQARPDVDVLDGLTTAIVVDQERMGADPRSTVGTATDANALLRILFSRLGEPHVGSPKAFSFNVASVSGSGAVTFERGGKTVKERRSFSITGGMCPHCEGRGTVPDIDLTEVFDDSKSLAEGAITVPNYTADGWMVALYTESGLLDPDKPIRDYTDTELHDFLHHEGTKVKVNGVNRTYEGLLVRLQTSMFSKDRDALQPHIRRFVDRAATFADCPECDGTRLGEGARSSKIAGRNIAEACALQISDLAEWVRDLDEPSVAPLLTTLQRILDSFMEIGLGYLSLNRSSGTLSGGEAQRVKMIRHLGSALTDVTYVFDEPTIGLHAHDVARMIELLRQLRDKGNSVLVVEHEPDVIVAADHVVDMGPDAGPDGGRIVFQGDVEGLRNSGTRTGQHLERRTPIRTDVRGATDHLTIEGASLHNLRDVTVDIPLGVLVVVTGVAGSGKSSLIDGCLPRRDDMVFVDQSPIRGSRRSIPATYTGIFDHVRKAFAKANDVSASLFSFNSDGACPECDGLGLVYTQLAVMEEVATVCEVCEGRRFADAVLEFELRGENISDVLAMTVDEASEFFTEKPVRRMLTSLGDVGLGYLKLGQALTTLSGGERQRLRLAIEMAGDAAFYVLDEPSSGLHMADVDRLVALLDRLVDDGRTVLVIEHDLDIVARADWVIDLGPGAGHDGGTVVFAGTPADLADHPTSLTGKHLGAERARDERTNGSGRSDPQRSELEDLTRDELYERAQRQDIGSASRSGSAPPT